MSPSRKPNKPEPDPSPEDTQEMFTAGHGLPVDGDEPAELETVQVVEEADEPVEDSWEDDGYEWEELPEDDRGLDGDEPEEDLYEDPDDELDPVPDGELEDELYEEPEDEVEEPGREPPAAPAGERDGEPEDRLAELKALVVELWDRADALAVRMLRRVGDIEPPRWEIDPRKALVVAGIVAVALVGGTAGYLAGKGSGDDVDSARLEGEFAGRRAGAIAGATKGYAAGFKQGRDAAFGRSYSSSYRRNYRRAYENAGVEAPKHKDIEVPRP